MVKQELIKEYNVIPPTNIGRIYSQWTSLSNGIWLMLKGVFSLMLGIFFLIVVYVSDYDLWIKVLIFLLPCILFIWVGISEIRKANSLYWIIVGEEGFARYKVSKKEKRLYDPIYYMYKDMTDLYFPQTKCYTNGSYEHTTYHFIIFNSGEKIYTESGTYEETVNDSDNISYVLDIEKQWTQYLLQRMTYDLQNKGFVVFNSVEIGFGYLKYKDKMCRKEQIQNYHIEAGILTIYFMNYSKIEIDVNNITNQKCFLNLLNTLVLK
ncbi:MAG: hypothetical protein LBR10_14760 [Prevotellaceae bacterium]|jgi:hypothetical protein|nr:hypothetical protein [Prevotellaceae bacterium]